MARIRWDRDGSVERDDSRDALGIVRGGEEVRELDAAAEAGNEDSAAAAFFADEFRSRVDVRLEKIVGPSRQLGEIGLWRLGRNEMRAVVHRPHVNAVLGQVNLERVARVLERHFAVHVGAGQIEHHGVGMRGRIRPLGDAMQRDFIEWRFADGRFELPFVNSGRAFEFARRADGLKVRGRCDSSRREEAGPPTRQGQCAVESSWA